MQPLVPSSVAVAVLIVALVVATVDVVVVVVVVVEELVLLVVEESESELVAQCSPANSAKVIVHIWIVFINEKCCRRTKPDTFFAKDG